MTTLYSCYLNYFNQNPMLKLSSKPLLCGTNANTFLEHKGMLCKLKTAMALWICVFGWHLKPSKWSRCCE